MIRVARSQSGIVVDRTQREPGRGAYVHDDATCIQAAVMRGGLARTLRCAIPAELGQLLTGKAGK